MDANWYHLCTLPHPRSPVSSRKEPVYLGGTLIFVAATQGTPLDHRALVASGAHAYRSQRTVTSIVRVLNPLHPWAYQRSKQTKMPILSVKET